MADLEQINLQLGRIEQSINGLGSKVEEIKSSVSKLTEETSELHIKFVLVESQVEEWKKLNIPQCIEDVNNFKKLGIYNVINNAKTMWWIISLMVTGMVGVLINTIIGFLK
ncbi:MAG: hypothetical protein ACOYWZ_16085 [Bacillota bacterium]